MEMKGTLIDVVIIGSGCAGYTAGIYTSRAGFNTVIISGLYECD
jgi:thioredoxin reductase (NADPH)